MPHDQPARTLQLGPPSPGMSGEISERREEPRERPHGAGSTDVCFPGVGEAWGDFHLVAELGRGAQGRVYLAAQMSLAARPMVLKIARRAGTEHLSLARLQHTHIVPLYSVQNDPVHNLRTLCMPYFGGATLAALLERLRPKPLWQRTGQDLLDALEEAPAAAGASPSPGGAARSFLARASYVQAICWIGACLADALHYAHERDLVHLDVKPDNVLLAVDGQPMLLDFHLAQPPLRHDGPTPERLGGTVAYVSPEQQAAFESVRAKAPVPTDVDGRSDIYSLGLVLYEALGRSLPTDVNSERSWLHRLNPQVSVGLADIISRCLTSDPGMRYAQAAELASDLRRHVSDLPLRGVRNRSLAERWRKWRRRRPHALALLVMFLVVLAAAGAATLGTWHQFQLRVREADAASREAGDLLHQNSFAEAARMARLGLTRVDGLPATGDLPETLRQQLRLAQRGQAAHDLHVLADRVRFSYGEDDLSEASLRALAQSSQAAWERRDQLLFSAKAPHAPDATELERSLRADLFDLAVLGAAFQARRASTQDARQAGQDLLQRLDEAEALHGPSPVLERERLRHAQALGRSELLQACAQRLAGMAPRNAWEHETLGRSLLGAGELERAAAELRHAVDLEPQRFWSHFFLGVCSYRLRRFEDALSAFQACVVLKPNVPQCFHNRARVLTALGRTESALRDYDRALALDPALALAALHRGMLHAQRKHYAEAIRDFQRALGNGADPGAAHYQLALVHLAQKNLYAADASARQALQFNHNHREARTLLDRLRVHKP